MCLFSSHVFNISVIYSCDCVPSKGIKVMELGFFTPIFYISEKTVAHSWSFMLPPFLNCASMGPRSVKQGLILVFSCYCQATVIFLIDYLTFLAQKSWNSLTLNCRNIINLLSMHKISVKGAVWPVPDFPFRKAMYYGRKGKPHSALLEQTKWANLNEIKSDHLLKT